MKIPEIAASFSLYLFLSAVCFYFYFFRPFSQRLYSWLHSTRFNFFIFLFTLGQRLGFFLYFQITGIVILSRGAYLSLQFKMTLNENSLVCDWWMTDDKKSIYELNKISINGALKLCKRILNAEISLYIMYLEKFAAIKTVKCNTIQYSIV